MVSHWPFTAEALVQPRPLGVRVVVDEVALRQGVLGALHFYPASIIAPMFCTHAHQILLLVVGQKGEALEPTQSSALSAVGGALEHWRGRLPLFHA